MISWGLDSFRIRRLETRKSGKWNFQKGQKIWRFLCPTECQTKVSTTEETLNDQENKILCSVDLREVSSSSQLALTQWARGGKDSVWLRKHGLSFPRLSCYHYHWVSNLLTVETKWTSAITPFPRETNQPAGSKLIILDLFHYGGGKDSSLLE